MHKRKDAEIVINHNASKNIANALINGIFAKKIASVTKKVAKIIKKNKLNVLESKIKKY